MAQPADWWAGVGRQGGPRGAAPLLASSSQPWPGAWLSLTCGGQRAALSAARGQELATRGQLATHTRVLVLLPRWHQFCTSSLSLSALVCGCWPSPCWSPVEPGSQGTNFIPAPRQLCDWAGASVSPDVYWETQEGRCHGRQHALGCLGAWRRVNGASLDVQGMRFTV